MVITAGFGALLDSTTQIPSWLIPIQSASKRLYEGPSDGVWATVDVNKIGTTIPNKNTNMLANARRPLINIEGRWVVQDPPNGSAGE